MSRTVIFYGAGGHARAHLDRWVRDGSIPSCFVDADTGKQGKKLLGYDILSLENAISAFPDYELHIALSEENRATCRERLLSLGIPPGRIKFAGMPAPDCRFGCEFLHEFISVSPLRVMTCPDQQFGERASFNVECTDLKNLRHALSENMKKRRNAVAAFENSGKSPCSDCQHLRWGRFPAEPAISRISFCGAFNGEHCNLSCCYCNMPGYGNVSMRLIDAVRTVGEFFHGTRLNINFATGEFFSRSDCDEVLDFCHEHRYLVNFTTNGSLYRDAIVKLAKEKNVEHMNISLDSGTPETYARIKGVDCFGRTVGNLEKYSALRIPLVLKYILLEGINDNPVDIDGFFRIAGRLSASVAISSNEYVRNSRLKQKTMDIIASLIRKCRQSGLKIILYRDFFNREDAEVLERMIS